MRQRYNEKRRQRMRRREDALVRLCVRLFPILRQVPRAKRPPK